MPITVEVLLAPSVLAAFLTSLVAPQYIERLLFALQDHFRAKIRIVLSKLCRKFGFEEIKALMPEQDKKLVAHMQTTAERELKAKKTRLAGGRGGGDDGGRGGGANPGEGKITKAVRTFDTIMEGTSRSCHHFVFVRHD